MKKKIEALVPNVGHSYNDLNYAAFKLISWFKSSHKFLLISLFYLLFMQLTCNKSIFFSFWEEKQKAGIHWVSMNGREFAFYGRVGGERVGFATLSSPQSLM